MTRIRTWGWVVCVLAALAFPLALAAQAGAGPAGALRGQLETRGLPAGLTAQVESLAVRAAGDGLPWQPLADKAIEGWAKHVPAARIVAAVRVFAERMGDGRAAVRTAGMGEPDAALIRAAAEALGSGLAQAQIGALVRAAPRPALAAPALTVAAALHAQGFSAEQAVSVVAESLRGGRTMTQILDMPQAARAMQQHGMPPADIGRVLRGGLPPPGGTMPAHGRLPPGADPPPLPRQPMHPPDLPMPRP